MVELASFECGRRAGSPLKHKTAQPQLKVSRGDDVTADQNLNQMHAAEQHVLG
jgi:hypothetical protein